MVSLKEICTNVVGIQDTRLKDLNGKRLLYNEVIETKKFTNSGKITHKIEFPSDGTGVANMKIYGNWESVRLMVGGQQFDKLSKDIPINTFQMLNDGCCLPYLEYHNIEFFIEGGDYQLEYDIVSVDFNFEIDQEYFVKQLQYSGPEKNVDKININFNHPVEKIIVYTEKPVSNVQFLMAPNVNTIIEKIGLLSKEIKKTYDSRLDQFLKSSEEKDLVIKDFLLLAQRANAIDTKYFFPFRQIDPTHWELDFEPTLNFSVFDYRQTCIVCDSSFKDNTINYFGITHHLVKFMHGMAGLVFSK